MMKKHWIYFMFLLLIVYLIIFGSLMFSQGFMLSRDTFDDISKCKHISTTCSSSDSDHCSSDDLSLHLSHLNNSSLICLPKQSKVILLLIDALRYDFTTYNSKLNPLPYENKLKVIHDLIHSKPRNTKLFKFIADPPTTTMQRLKALTTGSLPTFIDAGSNFATPEINEDNLIDQLARNEENVVFMGDDTWIGLYPKRFKRYWPFPSFNVWDLDTVDNGVVGHLYSEIQKSNWSLLIGHFLGVDHCGHRYGPFHKEMERKLTEMNDVIKNVVNLMDEDTMLFVIGDHGMTNTGDHGGDTEQEVTAAMFIYSSKPLVYVDYKDRITSVKQIDLVPTLSTILGVPIPFSNLGSVIYEALPSTGSPLKNLQLYLMSLWSNVQQTFTYINKYSSVRDNFDHDKLSTLNNKYSVLNAKLTSISDEPQLKLFVHEAQDYLGHIREMCEEVWIQFDSSSMSRGLLLTFLTIFFVYLIVYGIPNQKLSVIFGGSLLLYWFTAVVLAGSVSVASYSLSLVDHFKSTLFFSTGFISVLAFTFLIIQNWEDITANWYENSRKHKLLRVTCRILLLITLIALFTNSYIIEEASVLSYVLLTLVFVIIFTACIPESAQKYKSNDRSLKYNYSSVKTRLVLLGFVLAGLVRFSGYYWRCREEQKSCSWTTNEQIIKVENNSGKIKCICTMISLALLVTLTKMWMRSCGNLVGYSPLVLLTKYAPTVNVVCMGGFWVLKRFPKDTNIKPAVSWNTDMLMWTAYGTTIVMLLTVIIQPLAIYIVPKKKENVSGDENLIPQLFHQVKGLFRKNSDENGATPIVYGLGTVYSAPFVITSVTVTLLIALLLGDILAPTAVIMYFTAVVALVILSIANYRKSLSIEQIFNVPNSSVLCWALLSQYFFYGTSHQPTFSSIQWEAAFVGTSGIFSNNVIPAILIGINTFGSYILFGLMLPLLTIFPFALYTMCPSLATPKSLDTKNMKRGELTIYENDERLLNSAFVVSCKYTVLQSVRVFICMLSATIHCRHLMVWSIFAPKFIFEMVGMIVSLLSVLLSYLLLIRVNHCVHKLVLKLEKQSS